jgi:hypothetical protein
MSDKLRGQIYNSLMLKGTDELLEIWQKNDRAEWSDTAFEVIEEILKERDIAIPLQSNPVDDIAEYEDGENLGFSNVELKIIDDENPPDFYDPFDVLKTSKNLDYVAKVAVVVSLLSLVPGFLQVKDEMDSMFFSVSFMDFIPIIASLGLTIVGVALQIIFTYFPLKALAHILRVLMEMEFNSRKAK